MFGKEGFWDSRSIPYPSIDLHIRLWKAAQAADSNTVDYEVIYYSKCTEMVTIWPSRSAAAARLNPAQKLKVADMGVVTFLFFFFVPSAPSPPSCWVCIRIRRYCCITAWLLTTGSSYMCRVQARVSYSYKLLVRT